MADSPNLPGDRAWPPKSPQEWRAFYAFFRDLVRTVQATNGNTTGLAALLARIEALENAPEPDLGQIFGDMSVSVLGLLGQVVQVRLVNDTVTPGTTHYYGTNADGDKGWHLLGDALLEGTGITLTVDGTTGEITVALEDVTPVSGGSFLLTTFDAQGRRSEESAGDAGDVPVDATGWTNLSGADVQAALDSADAAFDPAGSAAAALAAANAYTDDEITDYSSDAHTWSAAQTYTADILMSGATWRMVHDTADGADTGRWVAAGGGTPSAARGAYFAGYGNEHATFPGQAQIVAGAGADVVITASSGGVVRLSVDNAASFGTATFRYNGVYSTGLYNYGAEVHAGNQSPAQFTADQTDFALSSTAAWLRVSTNASRALNSMTGGSSGRRVLITNIGATNNLTIPNAGAGTAGNLFLTPGAVTFTLNPGDSVWAVYDAAIPNWRIIGA
jgi:hypothetical protein